MGELRRRLSNRTDSEHEQILVRLVIALLALAYLVAAASGSHAGASLATRCLPLAGSYVLGSVLLLAHLLLRPEPLPARRFVGMVLDLGTLTTALILGEATAAVFYPFYLWITVGMGFRYGRLYLLVSAVLSLISFASVIAALPYWHEQPALAGGLWAALVLLPAYAASLLAKLTDAVDRAEAASRAKSRFLATMSHELRTPLNAIIGVTDLLRASPLDGEQRDLIRTARVAGENLLDMINDVLDVARIEAGTTSAEAVDFDLHRLLYDIRKMLLPKATGQGLYLNLSIDPRVPYRLRGGERELRHILLNLVANGIKFTETGGVSIRITLAAEHAQRAGLVFEVEDTGIGIPEAARERIFEQFTQADESTTRRHDGSGLGLAIARKLTDLLEGRLYLAEPSGRGSRFVLEVELHRVPVDDEALLGSLLVIGPREAAVLWCARAERFGVEAFAVADLAEARRLVARHDRPVAALVLDQGTGTRATRIAPLVLGRAGGPPSDCILVSDAAHQAGDPYLARLGPDAGDGLLFRSLRMALMSDQADDPDPFVVRRPSSEPRQILLAEDNPTNQKVITRLLERAGHRVIVVDDGGAALDALEVHDVDLVLMDLNMPDMGGLEATRLYRFAHPQRDRPKIAALTADVTQETRAACAAAGIADVISKPVSALDLLDAVDRLTASSATADLPEGAGDATDQKVVPHPRRPSARTAVDLVHLGRLRQLDHGDGFFLNLLRDFLLDAEQLVAELRGAAADADAALFRDRAHALRSSAAHVGARALFDLCLGWRGITEAELRARQNAINARLTTEFERMRDELARHIEMTPVQDHAASTPREVRRPLG